MNQHVTVALLYLMHYVRIFPLISISLNSYHSPSIGNDNSVAYFFFCSRIFIGKKIVEEITLDKKHLSLIMLIESKSDRLFY